MTVTEIVLALALTLLVVATTLTLIEPAHRALAVRTQTNDIYQRARVGFVSFQRTLMNAATAVVDTEGEGESLRPAVRPWRWGRHGQFESDAMTLLTIPATPVRLVIGPVPGAEPRRFRLRPGPACRPLQASCGLRTGMTVMIFDHRGSSDLLRITDVGGEVISVDPMEGAFPAYPPGSAIIPVDVHSYYFDAPRAQVRHHDGWRTDAPVLDHVVALSFQYFGSSLQPDRGSERESPVCSTAARPWNGVSGPEVELLPDVLTEGPRCGSRPVFDADLFRVRRVRVALRLQASAAEHRGLDQQMFACPGTARDHKRFVPDVTVRFDVALRNP